MSEKPPPARAISESGRYTAHQVIGGKYELVRLLAEGGMGSVWVAHNQKLDVHVALKLVRHDLISAQAAERMLQEARATARLAHPAIVKVFDYGETEAGDPYLVMELLSGDGFDTLIETSFRIPATRAVQLLLPI